MKSTFFDRIYALTDSRSDDELGVLLGVEASAIAHAREHDVVPPEWLVTLVRLFGVNPAWLAGGEGPLYVIPDTDPDRDVYGNNHIVPPQSNAAILHNILQLIPTRYLAEELMRRTSEPVS